MLDDLPMSLTAKEKWGHASLDEKVLLRMGFSQIIGRPSLASFYEQRTYNLGYTTAHLFHFRIGACEFIVADSGRDKLHLFDFYIEPMRDYGLAAE